MNQHNELSDFSNWIKAADRFVQPAIGRSIHSITGLELFYWFKSGMSASGAASLAFANRERLDKAAVLEEAKAMYRRSQLRLVATGNENGFTAVDLETYPGYDILSSMPITEVSQ